MSTKRVLIFGSSGRMGQELCALAQADSRFRFVGGVDRAAQEGNLQFKSLNEVPPSDVDVVIDFSSPEASLQIFSWVEKSGCALVSGTTGFQSSHFEALKKASSRAPVLWSPNMSLGIAVFKELIGVLAQLNGYDFQIEEFHHRHKKDKPSGTALLLQKELVEHVATSQVPDPISIRGGGIFGIHRLYCMSMDEMISVEHTALSRSVFAKGALEAANWIVGRKPGVYELNDVLKRS